MAPKRETAQEIWGNELRHALEAAGMTGRQLAEAINFEPSTVSNWINGRRTPEPKVVDLIEEKLGTNGYLKRDLKWVRREISPEWSEWRGVEEEATELLNYENYLVPGLLQTPDYAQAVLSLEDKVVQRLERHQIFENENPPAYEALIDESVLYRKVGNAKIMAEQLRHLLSVVEADDIAIRIIPLSANLHRFDYPFHLATVESGKQAGYIEGTLRGRIVERPADAADLRRLWMHFGAAALSQEDSIRLIRTTIDERWATE
jgi:transcriptional regulator with XRE-family HTH domain